ncbi:transmembrane 9 superfamily member 7-like [Dioscorea cayenensis subsp. rotundata]|uniref:Transmembrane 9 superfamily member n=1 Tax=Dioscorea cayennensis subsp. rotundata TaxID=55577 RepID=A0AB40AVP2_DIOCR|nr:transmembrane 9 superfamily member 7-like [Dioscorea cayenensis subsp. rotundata]
MAVASRSSSLGSLAYCAHIFYLPGIAPRDFHKDDELQVKVDKLSSTKTQLPYDYYFLDFYKIMNSAENLGEVLHGDCFENSVYIFKMRNRETCRVACCRQLNTETTKNFMEKIDDEYQVNMILDNLPVVVDRQRRDESQTPSYEHGFCVGFKGNQVNGKDNNKYHINNHLSFKVMYHKDPESEDAHIVGFEHGFHDHDELLTDLNTIQEISVEDRDAGKPPLVSPAGEKDTDEEMRTCEEDEKNKHWFSVNTSQERKDE